MTLLLADVASWVLWAQMNLSFFLSISMYMLVAWALAAEFQS